MKHTLLILFLFITVSSFAQPQGINYQGVARDSIGHPVQNQNISLQLSILDGSATGSAVYVETQNTTTSGSGLFNVSIGMGNVISGVFTNIKWAQDDKWLKVEMDIGGGNTFQLLGATQFLSVPYALHSYNSLVTGRHFIGEQFGGGIIFYLYSDPNDPTRTQHGLVVGLNDLGQSVFSNIHSIEIGSSSQSPWNGLSNSLQIVNQVGHSNSAAKICLDYSFTDSTGTYDDWYLPAIDELVLIMGETYLLDKYYPAFSIQMAVYISSTEYDAIQFLGTGRDGNSGIVNKNNLFYVRPIRAF